MQMGLFDKLGDVAKKATKVAETYTQKAQEVIAGATASKTESGPQQPVYIPQSIDLMESVPIGSEELEPWEAVTGTARQFPLSGKMLEIPENLDVFNSYRLMFRSLAIDSMDKLEAEYNAQVHDFISFIELFPQIYDNNLYPLVKRAIDVLVSENIWTVTLESFSVQHKANYHLAIDDYETMSNSAALTMENNQQFASNISSAATDAFENSFSKYGALGATVFDAVKKSSEKKALENVGVNAEQQRELYGRINPQNLFNRVFADYMCVCISLIRTLMQNGRDIWLPTPEATQQAKNIFQNLSNPNFPQDKMLDVLLEILKTNPYNKDYHKFMISRFGDTEEVIAIKDYFGYTDFDNPRIN